MVESWFTKEEKGISLKDYLNTRRERRLSKAMPSPRKRPHNHDRGQSLLNSVQKFALDGVDEAEPPRTKKRKIRYRFYYFSKFLGGSTTAAPTPVDAPSDTTSSSTGREEEFATPRHVVREVSLKKPGAGFARGRLRKVSYTLHQYVDLPCRGNCKRKRNTVYETYLDVDGQHVTSHKKIYYWEFDPKAESQSPQYLRTEAANRAAGDSNIPSVHSPTMIAKTKNGSKIGGLALSEMIAMKKTRKEGFPVDDNKGGEEEGQNNMDSDHVSNAPAHSSKSQPLCVV